MDETLEVYVSGLIYVSICTNIKDRDRIVELLNKKHPTGINSRWDFAEDPTFASGAPNPAPCDRQRKGNMHYLMSC